MENNHNKKYLISLTEKLLEKPNKIIEIIPLETIVKNYLLEKWEYNIKDNKIYLTEKRNLDNQNSNKKNKTIELNPIEFYIVNYLASQGFDLDYKLNSTKTIIVENNKNLFPDKTISEITKKLKEYVKIEQEKNYSV